MPSLLEVSIPTLLGVGVEYIASAVAYFERMRQIEESSEHIIVLAGPISYLLASDAFDRTLEEILRESIPDTLEGRKRALDQVDEVMAVLRQRKDAYRKRQPGIVNLISAVEMGHFLRNGLVGRLDLPESFRAERRALARAEAEHFDRPDGRTSRSACRSASCRTRCRMRASRFSASRTGMCWRSAHSAWASSPISASASP